MNNSTKHGTRNRNSKKRTEITNTQQTKAPVNDKPCQTENARKQPMHGTIRETKGG